MAAAACGGAQTSQVLYPTRETGPLVRPADIHANFVWRQRIAVQFEKRHESFSAVIEKRGDHLILLGLTPFGTRAFALEQTAGVARFTPYMDLTLPFSPLYMLADVHRAFFRGLPGAPLADGWHEATLDGEQVREHWQGGLLLEREYKSLQDRGNAVQIRYGAGMAGLKPPAQIQLHSQRFGYTLDITTLLAQPLAAP
jgi:hypothetical protein